MIRTKLPSEFIEVFNEHIPYLTYLLSPVPPMDGIYLAGGLLRTLMNPNEEFSPEKTDVDLFFRDDIARMECQQYLETFTEYHKIYQCPENKLATYVYLNGEEPKWKIQLVTVDYYPNLESVIGSFDFTVTMFATDGENFVYGDTSIQDTLDKHLVWNKITYPASSLRRMMKYARKGYWMREEDYQEFVSKVWAHDGWIIDEKVVYVD